MSPFNDCNEFTWIPFMIVFLVGYGLGLITTWASTRTPDHEFPPEKPPPDP